MKFRIFRIFQDSLEQNLEETVMFYSMDLKMLFDP